MQPRPSPGQAVSVRESGAGWTWRVTTADGRQLGGDAADLESARRSGAFAAAVAEALARVRARRF